MVPLATLSYLSNQKLKDARALLKANRNPAAVYLAGYSLEIALKRKLSQVLGFNNGFPESEIEFRGYAAIISAFRINTGLPFDKLKEIKNHNLNQLLSYIGAQKRIVSQYYSEWAIVSNWNPEQRYKIRRFNSDKATDYIRAVVIILKQL